MCETHYTVINDRCVIYICVYKVSAREQKCNFARFAKQKTYNTKCSQNLCYDFNIL